MIHLEMKEDLYILKHVSKELKDLIALHDAYTSLSVIYTCSASVNTKPSNEESNYQLNENHTLSSEYLGKEWGKQI